jgi:NRPS condensation-like uncharacterized protein
MIRKLGIFERAMLICNKHAPFNIVGVLRMENGPTPDVLQGALKKLQLRQPFLRARIVEGEKQPFFECLFSTHFPFQVIERTSVNQWQEIVEKEMAFRYNHSTGPLFRATYIYEDGYGDLILNTHHTIMDAISGMNLLDELLSLCAEDAVDLPSVEPAPAMEDRFPSPYQGIRKVFKTAGYAFAQMSDMARYMWRTRVKRTPPVCLGGKGPIAMLILPEYLVDSLAHRGRMEGITLNSLMNAALVLATNRHLYGGQVTPMRTFVIADLRPYTQPPTLLWPLANYISMMGYTVDVSEDIDFWELARDLHTKIYRSLKQGDKFRAVLISEALLKMFTRMKSMRFGATALNYNGRVSLKTQYGKIKLVGLHGFVSGYDLGPEMSSQARLFNGQVWWDFTYLDTDMDAELAEKILTEVKLILESAGKG